MVELEGQDDRLDLWAEDGDKGQHRDLVGVENGQGVLVEEVLPAHGLIPPPSASDHDRYAYVIEGTL